MCPRGRSVTIQVMEQSVPLVSGAIADEAELLAGLRAGNDQAFAACVRAHSGRLLALARRILGDEHDAADAVQDAFLAAFREIGRFEGRSRLGTWLHRVTVNAALMRQRRRQRQPERSIEDLLPHFGEGEHQIDSPVPWKLTADEILVEQESRELVRRCIDQLPESYRTVLLLRDIEELDTEETAQMLGTSAGVVKTRLHRARQALRTLLDPYFRDDGP